MSNTYTLENVPRDLSVISNLSTAARFRLMLSLGAYPGNGSPEESAFVVAPKEIQSQVVLDALLNRDANGGSPNTQQAQQPQFAPPQQQIPQQQQQQMPVQMPLPFGNPQPNFQQPAQIPVSPVQVMPQPMGMSAVTPMPGIRPQSQGYTPPQQYPQQPAQPVQQQLPFNTQQFTQPQQLPSQGFPMPQQPPQIPQAAFNQRVNQIPATTPMMPQQPPMATQTNFRQPTTPSDPANIGISSGDFSQSAPQIFNSISRDLNYLKDTILGMARTQNMMGLILLEVAVKVLGADKEIITKMAAAASEQGEPEKMFSNAAKDLTGKK